MKDFKNLKDSTVLRVRVPKKLYESIKKELEKENVEETAKVEETHAPEIEKKEESIVNEYVGLDPELVPYATAAGLAIPAAVYLATLLKDKALIVFKKMAEKAKGHEKVDENPALAAIAEPVIAGAVGAKLASNQSKD